MLRSNRLFSVEYLNGLLDHDALLNFVAAEHYDWTNETNDLLTTGTGRFDGGIGVGVAPIGGTLINIEKTLSANLYIALTNLGTGDSALYLHAGTIWVLGVDNSDGDKFKIGLAELGASDAFEIDTSGNFDFKGGNFSNVGTIGGVTLSGDATAIEMSANSGANWWSSAGINFIEAQADGFLLYGGTNRRILTVTGGDWTLDQDVSSGADSAFGDFTGTSLAINNTDATDPATVVLLTHDANTAHNAYLTFLQVPNIELQKY